MAKTEAPAASGKTTKAKHRSPNYPAVGLEKAVELTGLLYSDYKTHSIPLALVLKKWEYKEDSGIGNQAVAALKSYGLIDVDGKGSARKVTISKEGQRIAGNAPDRAELLKKAWIRPKVHQEILEHYENQELPVDDLLRQYLVWERPEGQRFNPDTVDEFIGRFRSTMAYAGVPLDGKIGAWDGYEPEEEAETQGLAPKAPKTRLERNRTMSAGMKEDVFSLDNGQAVIVQWPERMDPDLNEDVKDWLKIVSRKIQRSFDKKYNSDDPSLSDKDWGKQNASEDEAYEGS